MANPFQIAASGVTGSGTSRVYPVTAGTSSGDTICIVVSVSTTGATVSACTDSKGNVYTIDKSYTAATQLMYMISSAGATGGSGGGATAALTTSDTITLTTAASSGNVQLAAASVPGVSAVDQIATIAIGSSTSPSVSATPGFNNETLIGALVNQNSGGAPSLAAGWTQAAQETATGTAYDTLAYDVLTGGSGAPQAFSATLVSSNWRAGMWTFKPGVTGQSAALPVAQETIAARTPAVAVGAVSLSLPVARMSIAAPAPLAAVSSVVALPTARVTIAAPAFATPVPTITVALPVARLSASALPIFPYVGQQVFVMAGTVH